MTVFGDLENRYGEITAIAMLLDMERQAGLNSAALTEMDFDARLHTALALIHRRGGTTEIAAVGVAPVAMHTGARRQAA